MCAREVFPVTRNWSHLTIEYIDDISSLLSPHCLFCHWHVGYEFFRTLSFQHVLQINVEIESTPNLLGVQNMLEMTYMCKQLEYSAGQRRKNKDDCENKVINFFHIFSPVIYRYMFWFKNIIKYLIKRSLFKYLRCNMLYVMNGMVYFDFYTLRYEIDSLYITV